MSTKVNTVTTSVSQDMRTAVGGNVDNLVSPGAAVGGAGGGAIVAGQGANVTQNTSGLSGADVKGMFDQFLADRNSERASVGSLGASLASGLQAQGQQLAETLAATKAPESTTLTALLPLVIIIAIVFALKG
jgi:hypothetical protein